MKLIVREPALRPIPEAPYRSRKSAFARENDFIRALQFLPYQEAIDAGEAKAGAYSISYVVGTAEGTYQLIDGEMAWCEPKNENIHIEISVRETQDDRFVPCLHVLAAVYDNTGRLVEARLLPFSWHPWQCHYSGDYTLPIDREYTLRVRIEASDELDCQSAHCAGCPNPIEVEFRNILIRSSDLQ